MSSYDAHPQKRATFGLLLRSNTACVPTVCQKWPEPLKLIASGDTCCTCWCTCQMHWRNAVERARSWIIITQLFSCPAHLLPNMLPLAGTSSDILRNWREYHKQILTINTKIVKKPILNRFQNGATLYSFVWNLWNATRAFRLAAAHQLNVTLDYKSLSSAISTLRFFVWARTSVRVCKWVRVSVCRLKVVVRPGECVCVSVSMCVCGACLAVAARSFEQTSCISFAFVCASFYVSCIGKFWFTINFGVICGNSPAPRTVRRQSWLQHLKTSYVPRISGIRPVLTCHKAYRSPVVVVFAKLLIRQPNRTQIPSDK